MESPGNLIGFFIGLLLWFVVVGSTESLPFWLVVLCLPVFILVAQIVCRLPFDEPLFPWQLRKED